MTREMGDAMHRAIRTARALVGCALLLGAAASQALVAQLAEIPGLGAADVETLADAGIETPQQLLERAARHTQRLELAKQSGIGAPQISRWIHFVDLTRVPGLGVAQATLLDASGVNTARELAKRNPEKLLQRVARVNVERRLLPETPSLTELEAWIRAARELPRIIE